MTSSALIQENDVTSVFQHESHEEAEAYIPTRFVHFENDSTTTTPTTAKTCPEKKELSSKRKRKEEVKAVKKKKETIEECGIQYGHGASGQSFETHECPRDVQMSIITHKT